MFIFPFNFLQCGLTKVLCAYGSTRQIQYHGPTRYIKDLPLKSCCHGHKHSCDVFKTKIEDGSVKYRGIYIPVALQECTNIKCL